MEYRTAFIVPPLTVHSFVDSAIYFVPAMGMMLIAVAPSITKHAIARYLPKPPAIARVAIFLLSVFILYCGINYEIIGTIAAARDARTGNCTIAEGKVEAFLPEPAAGHGRRETFSVNGTNFSYSAYASTLGFHRSMFQGGPIRQGLQVRICHQNGVILRLDVQP
jgi:hypothetical protein